MTEQLNSFLRNNGYYLYFSKFIETKIKKTTTETLEETNLIKYKFESDIQKIITEFLSKYQTVAENFKEADKNVKKAYLKELVPDRQNKHAGRKQGIYTSRNNTKDIREIFEKIFELKKSPHKTTLLKEYTKRLEHIIKKETFTEKRGATPDPISVGLFFLTIEYYLAKLAKQEKLKAKEDEKYMSPTDPLNMDSIFTNPEFQYDAEIGGRSKTDIEYMGMVEEYFQNTAAFDKMKLGPKIKFRKWLKDNAEAISRQTKLNKEVQEGKHSVLITYENIMKNDIKDVFAPFIFSQETQWMNKYPYFFKGSKRTALQLPGASKPIYGYTHPKFKEDDFFGNCKFSVSDLDTQLKPIWFRAITKENKQFKKLSMEELHAIAKDYANLLLDNIIKYIELKYQCTEDKIFVQFRTNNFDSVPKTFIMNDKDFKAAYNKNPKRALYRGLSDDKAGRQPHILFKKLKEKGISYNIRKHNEQDLGAGIYWGNLKTAQSYVKDGVIAMGIAIEDLPTASVYRNTTTKQHMSTTLMRGNRYIAIRETAMSIKLRKELTKDTIDEYKKYDVVVFDTKDEQQRWLECK